MAANPAHAGCLLKFDRLAQINPPSGANRLSSARRIRLGRVHPRRNVLQKALGGGNQFVDPQVGAVAFHSSEIFQLCTDDLVEGLHDNHPAEQLRSPDFAGSDANLAHRLVETAVQNDGRYNATAPVIQVAKA